MPDPVKTTPVQKTDFLQLGSTKGFEAEITGSLKKASGIDPDHVRPMNKNTLDKYNGTDLVYDGLRVDITQNFAHKDHMILIKDSGIPATRGQNFMIGIRTGNGHKGYTPFYRPVIVVGVDLDRSDYRFYSPKAIKNMQEHGKELMEMASDTYYHFTDAVKDPGLKPNPYLSNEERTAARKDKMIAALMDAQTFGQKLGSSADERKHRLEQLYDIAIDQPYYEQEMDDLSRQLNQDQYKRDHGLPSGPNP